MAGWQAGRRELLPLVSNATLRKQHRRVITGSETASTGPFSRLQFQVRFKMHTKDKGEDGCPFFQVWAPNNPNLFIFSQTL